MSDPSSCKVAADGRVVACRHRVALEPADVGIELAQVFMLEAGHLELDQHMALQDTMVEDQVDETVRMADEDAFLARLEAETVAEFCLLYTSPSPRD